jgi:ATP-dependent exoDNAse (exonuclease V) beta subunit
VADLVFEDGGRWTVVDYKTDEQLDGRVYAAQLGVYVEGVRAATGQEVAGVLLAV